MNYSSKVKSMGINNFNYRRYSFDYFLDSVKRLGLDTIELCGCHPHFTVYEHEEFPVGELAQKIKDHGIKVSAIIPEQNFLPINIAAVNEYLRQQSVEQIKFYVKNAKAFDCDKVIVYPGKAFMNYPQSEAWMRARKSLRPLMDRVERFAEQYTKKLSVFDTADYPLEGINPKFNKYLSTIKICAMFEVLSTHLEKERNHSLDLRRYYRVIEY